MDGLLFKERFWSSFQRALTVVKRELAAIICGHRGNRVGGQEGEQSVLRTPGGLHGDCRNLRPTYKPGLAFHTGTYPTRVPTVRKHRGSPHFAARTITDAQVLDVVRDTAWVDVVDATGRERRKLTPGGALWAAQDDRADPSHHDSRERRDPCW